MCFSAVLSAASFSHTVHCLSSVRCSALSFSYPPGPRHWSDSYSMALRTLVGTLVGFSWRNTGPKGLEEADEGGLGVRSEKPLLEEEVVEVDPCARSYKGSTGGNLPSLLSKDSLPASRSSLPLDPEWLRALPTVATASLRLRLTDSLLRASSEATFSGALSGEFWDVRASRLLLIFCPISRSISSAGTCFLGSTARLMVSDSSRSRSYGDGGAFSSRRILWVLRSTRTTGGFLWRSSYLGQTGRGMQ